MRPISEIQATLANLGGAPANTIPNSEQEAVIKEALEFLPEFCFEVWKNKGYRTRGKDATLGCSHYWAVLDTCRIDMTNGLVFLDQKSRYAKNLLTLWMCHTGIKTDEDAVCKDKVLIQRAISSLRRWCTEQRKRRDGDQSAEDQTDYPTSYEFKDLVHDAVFKGRSKYRASASKFRKMVLKEHGEELKKFTEFSSGPQFLKLLTTWAEINDREFFTVTKHPNGKNSEFTLELV
jgi:hypothetical protein